MQPDLLLLDEITSALDPVLVAEVLDAIRELATEGMTMVIATHEMGFARDIANRVCFLAPWRDPRGRRPRDDVQRADARGDPSVPGPDHRGRPDVSEPSPARDVSPPMRGSRALWLSFAVAIVAAIALIPLGISRSRTAAASPSVSGPSGPPGWTTFSPSDRAFQVVGPAGRRPRS